MKINRRSVLAATAGPVFARVLAPTRVTAALNTSDSAPQDAIPSARQLVWSKLEFYNFLHFSMNTFTDKEWGYGDEDPRLFNPTAFDADQIIEALKGGGSKGVILTCKHHDGFCLWPTRTTEHSIRKSTFQSGRGDIVRDLSRAAARAGLKFGVYLSPWDRNQATYGTPQYLRIYRDQMRELLTNYGPIFEIWHDGANGGDGFYGGAREKRIIDKLHYYDWPNTWALERELQPNANLFSDVGPDIRWVGNENGVAGDPCWATYTPRSPRGGPGSPGDVVAAEATSGTRNGKFWMPAECDVSIRPGWFWHAAEDDQVKRPEQLFDLYMNSVGRGASFLLNVPPDRRGLLHQADVSALRGFGKIVQSIFAHDLAAGAHRIASGAETVLELPQPAEFNLVRLREQITFGQRVAAFSVETWQEGEWKKFVEGTSIGICRLLKQPQAITAKRIRVRVTQSTAPPALAEIGLYRCNV